MRASSLAEARTTQLSFLITNALFVFGMVAVGLWAAWPIYQSGYFFITAVGAVVVGTVIAWVGMRRNWSWFTLVLAAVGAYLLLGVPLAVPAGLTSVPAFAGGFVKLLTATVFSWKELVTISIPVGSYQTMLVPLLILTPGRHDGRAVAGLAGAATSRSRHSRGVRASALRSGRRVEPGEHSSDARVRDRSRPEREPDRPRDSVVRRRLPRLARA
jgi:hypothetical protein